MIPKMVAKGYSIYPSLYAEFKAYCKENRLTDSEGVRRAIKTLLRENIERKKAEAILKEAVYYKKEVNNNDSGSEGD